MKLNLPMTLISSKISSLLLLTLMNLKEVEAEGAFKNCLTDNNYAHSFYNSLLKYPFASNSAINGGLILKFCCDGSQCISRPDPCASGSRSFGCAKVGQTIFCDDWYSVCGGIIGSTAVSNITSGSLCSRFEFEKIPNYFSTITPNKTDKGYAYWECPAASPCNYNLTKEGAWCRWDNGGWTCVYAPGDECNYDSLGNYICSMPYCYLQWTAPWPGTSETNPYPQNTSTATTISILPTSTEIINNPNNDHLLEKIVIPVGTVTGTGLIGGLTYYYCKKRKKKNNLTIQEVEDNNNHHLKDEVIELTDQEATPVIKEIVDSNETEIQEVGEQTSQLVTLTPPESPLPHRSPQQLPVLTTLNPKQLLLSELRTKLAGQEQLWTNYLDVYNLVTNNPSSQIANQQFQQVQNQLLQIFTLAELGLLLENQTANPVHNPHTEYSEFVEVAQSPISYDNPHHQG